MSKFKVGDRVRIIDNADEMTIGLLGTVFMTRDTPGNDCRAYECRVRHARAETGDGELFNFEDLEPATAGPTSQVTQRRVFKLIKATPTHKVGTLFKEDCDDGTQPYSTFELEGTDNYLKIVDRAKVEDQPSWFIEVFKVEPEYMTAEELERWEAFKAQKPAARKPAPKRAAARPTAKRVKKAA